VGILDFLTVTKRPGEGTPIKQAADVKAALLALNRDTAPWHVREAIPEEGCDLVVEWKIVDAQWFGIFSKSKLESVFKILLKFDGEHNEVRALDKEYTVSWSGGVPTLSGASSFRGQKTEVSIGIGYGFTEKGTLGQVYNYRFSTGEMKKPVKETVTAAGWGYKGIVFGKL
jgi:hypothetical protein